MTEKNTKDEWQQVRLHRTTVEALKKEMKYGDTYDSFICILLLGYIDRCSKLV